jgi:decaprenylphospho-beta-D-erythro-pentofuranosid-2-ulose 2-reductase
MLRNEKAGFIIFGATSAIASATALLLAERGAQLFLIGRSEERTQAVASDIRTRTQAVVHCAAADLNRTEEHQRLIGLAKERLGRLDGVVIAHGILGSQERSIHEFSDAKQILETNFVGPVSILTHVANIFEQQGHGQIVVIGSVAGDRGRQSNYVYGASKGGLEIFVQGLRNRLNKSGATVLLVKPGFVDTPMTRDIPKNPLFSKPETVARAILSGLDRRKDCIYVPWFWSLIMLGIRNIPEIIFKRLQL